MKKQNARGNKLQTNVLVIFLYGLTFATAQLPCAAQKAAIGQRNTSASTELLLDGDDIVTTATRTSQRLTDSPEAVTVISEDDIRASGQTTIPELLRSVPGVDVMEPNKSQENVAIRGFNNTFAATVLVMVDGRRINEDFHDSVFWNTEPILLSRIKRIEIVRGPSSVLYGADAFSGVINIILKTPREMAEDSKPATFVGQYEGHTTTFAEGTYSAANKNKDFAVTVGAGYHGVIGLNGSQTAQIPDSSSVPIYTIDIQKHLPRGFLLLSADNADAKADLTSEILMKDARFHTSNVGLTYDEDRGANPVTARYYNNYMRLIGTNSYSASSSSEFDIQQIRPVSAASSLTYGATYRGDTVLSTPSGPDKHSEHVLSVFLQDQSQIGATTTLFAGIRDDDHSVYGTQISTRVSLVNHLSTNSSLRLSYGTAFSAPTVTDEYLDFSSPLFPGLMVNYVSNTSLKPEEISSSELGYRKDFTAGYAGLNIFFNNISNIIEPEDLQFAPFPYPAGVPTRVDFANLGSAHAEGFELEGGFPIARGWSGLASYSYQDVRGQNGVVEDFSPHDKMNLTIQSDRRRRLSMSFVGHYVSSSTCYGQTLRDYTTVDGRIAYRLGRSQDAWTAAIDSTNLLDDHHREFVDSPANTATVATAEQAFRTIRLELSGSF